MSEITTAQQLGYLTRAIEEHGKIISDLRDAIRQQNADIARRVDSLAAQVDVLTDRASELAQRDIALEADVAPLKELARDVSRIKERGIGILAVGSILMSVAVWVITSLWDRILFFLSGGHA